MRKCMAFGWKWHRDPAAHLQHAVHILVAKTCDMTVLGRNSICLLHLRWCARRGRGEREGGIGITAQIRVFPWLSKSFRIRFFFIQLGSTDENTALSKKFCFNRFYALTNSTYSMEQSPSWVANISSTSQKSLHFIQPKDHYRIYNRPPPTPIQDRIFPFHTCIRQWGAELCLRTNS